jgi:hypothetical protein
MKIIKNHLIVSYINNNRYEKKSLLLFGMVDYTTYDMQSFRKNKKMIDMDLFLVYAQNCQIHYCGENKVLI